MLRVSLVRSIFSPCVCAYTGARLKPKTLTPAPPIKVVLMKVLLETSIETTSRLTTLGGWLKKVSQRRLGPSITKVNAEIATNRPGSIQFCDNHVHAPKDRAARRKFRRPTAQRIRDESDLFP